MINYILTNQTDFDMREYGPERLKRRVLQDDILETQIEVRIDY